jgi:hypothetical protein
MFADLITHMRLTLILLILMVHGESAIITLVIVFLFGVLVGFVVVIRVNFLLVIMVHAVATRTFGLLIVLNNIDVIMPGNVNRVICEVNVLVFDVVIHVVRFGDFLRHLVLSVVVHRIGRVVSGLVDMHVVWIHWLGRT